MTGGWYEVPFTDLGQLLEAGGAAPGTPPGGRAAGRERPPGVLNPYDLVGTWRWGRVRVSTGPDAAGDRPAVLVEGLTLRCGRTPMRIYMVDMNVVVRAAEPPRWSLHAARLFAPSGVAAEFLRRYSPPDGETLPLVCRPDPSARRAGSRPGACVLNGVSIRTVGAVMASGGMTCHTDVRGTCSDVSPANG